MRPVVPAGFTARADIPKNGTSSAGLVRVPSGRFSGLPVDAVGPFVNASRYHFTGAPRLPYRRRILSTKQEATLPSATMWTVGARSPAAMIFVAVKV